jgi:SAM-dependent methyltransferase
MSESLKSIVREKYSALARQDGSAPCCSDFSESYDGLAGYVQEANLGLGCGLPTQFAGIRPGQTVVDLGSGAGNDAFVACEEVGPEGRVVGIDFSEDMLAKARANAHRRGLGQASFLLGDIEAIPLPEATADVVVSNCVLNLVPDKPKAFSEMRRILKPGGHFSVSDVVSRGELPASLQADAEAYAGCVAGAWPEQAYLEALREAGFEGVSVQQARPIAMPPDLLSKHLGAGAEAWLRAGNGLFSITVYGRRPQ